jgi:hypothetical protein
MVDESGLTSNAVAEQVRLLNTQIGALIQAIRQAFPNSGVIAGTARLAPQTFASLPAASAANEGSLASVTDSTTAVWGATITGGGANHVLAFSNRSNWTVAGK